MQEHTTTDLDSQKAKLWDTVWTPRSLSAGCPCRSWALSPPGTRTRLSAHFTQRSTLKLAACALETAAQNCEGSTFHCQVSDTVTTPSTFILLSPFPSLPLSHSDVYLLSFTLAHALSRQVAQACSGKDTNSFQLPSLKSCSPFTMKALLWETTITGNKVSSCWKSLQ